MKWSWRLGKIAGIDVYMHVTFLLLLAWVAMSYYLPRKSLADVAAGLLFVFILFTIIVLHELGHALTARRFGIRTRDITLLPIGGLARLERMPEDPKQELLVALAGPAVNAALAIVLFFLLVASGRPAIPQQFALVGGDLLANLLWINVAIAAFNMLPAFPMDGGRVLRALLAMRMEYSRATQIAATVGQAMAFVFGFVGLFTNPFLVFIALFVWMGAQAEAGMVEARTAFRGIPVSRAMITDFRTLEPTDPLQRGVDYILAGFQQDFPVLDRQGSVVGVLTRDAMLRALTRLGADAAVAVAMTTSFETVDPGEMLDGAVQRLQGRGSPSLPVVRDGRLVGMLTLENIGELIMIDRAVRAASPGR